jgi:hypothetical protein
MKTLMAALALAALMAAPALAGAPCTNAACEDGSCGASGWGCNGGHGHFGHGGLCGRHGCFGGGQGVSGTSYNSDLYAHPMYGGPVNLVVPPNAYRQGHYTWGVPSSHTTYIRSRFARGGNGGGYGESNVVGYGPRWPQSTSQLGVYYTRAPYCY